MIYIDKRNDRRYLIYCYSDFKNQWKIEHVPFDNWVSVVSEKEKDAFIRRNKLVEEKA